MRSSSKQTKKNHVHVNTEIQVFGDHQSPGTSYDKWMKTYGAELTKLWLPYEWFDTVEKLDYPELPSYWHWFSKLKNETVLTTKKYFQCRRVWN